jgi:hypothetical protein
VLFFFKYLSQRGIFERERACHVKGRWPYILVKISKGCLFMFVFLNCDSICFCDWFML